MAFQHSAGDKAIEEMPELPDHLRSFLKAALIDLEDIGEEHSFPETLKAISSALEQCRHQIN